MGWLTRLELATTSATNWRSTNWTTVTINGVSEGIRTPDPRLRRALLYPAELQTHILTKKWSGKRGSNSRHSAWKADALPTELFPQMVGIARFELAAPCSQGKCATGLRYIPTSLKTRIIIPYYIKTVNTFFYFFYVFLFFLLFSIVFIFKIFFIILLISWELWNIIVIRDLFFLFYYKIEEVQLWKIKK